MNNIVPFDGSGRLPAYLANAKALPDFNQDVLTAPAFPSMSIKGKVFTVVRDGLRATLMKPPPDEDETAQKIEVSVLRANMHSRVFYAKAYDEDSSAAAPPDCYTMDDVRPSPNAPNKQSDFCATCPHSVWGTGNIEKGTGRRCGDTPRLAIATPDKLNDPYLLRLPPASIKNWKDAVKIVKQRNIPYTALVYRISFDATMATPLLLFKPVGLLDDESFGQSGKLYDSDIVRSIVGVEEAHRQAPTLAAPPPPAGVIGEDELDAALAARAATQQAAAKAKSKPPAGTVSADELARVAPAPKPVPVPSPPKAAQAAPAPAPVQAPAPAKAAVDTTSDDDLLSGIAGLLDSPDD